MISALLSRCILLVFGTLYPAYRSYKAIKNKDVREYVKWMMYWIIFALFITGETFADIFLSWLPLYYEIKIVFIIWLLSPATKGSSILYRKFVHPRLVKHEKKIDKYISHAQKRSYNTLMDVGRKGLNVAADTLMKTASTGQYQLIETLKRYNSMQELRAPSDTTDDTVDAGGYSSKRSTWHEGMSSSNPQIVTQEEDFDPENDDVDALRRQYRHRQESTINEDRYEQHEMHRSQSEQHVPRGASAPTYDVDREVDFITKPRTTSDEQLYTSNTTVPSSSNVDYNYAYSSATLPRARKPKKPIHESMPVTTKNTRPRRTAADKKTAS